MKLKTYLLAFCLSAILLLPEHALAQITYPSWGQNACNTLDDLALGSLNENESDFWYNFPGAESDAVIANERTVTGNRAIRLLRPNSSYFDDVVYDLNGYVSGRHRIEWQMYLPSGSAATAGLVNDFDGTGGPGSNWAYRIEFNSNGLATVLLGQTNSPLSSVSYPRNRWFRVAQVVDLEEDFVRMFIDNVHVGDWRLSDGEDSPGSLSLDVVNIWAKIGTDLPASQSPIYIDAMCHSVYQPGVIVDCFEPNPTCLLGEDLFNECFALEQGYIAGEWTEGSCEGGGDENICTDAIQLDCNTTYLGNNDDSDNNYTVLDYTCEFGNTNYNGPDDLFRIEHPGGRFVVSLMNDNGVDFDLFLMSGVDCNDGVPSGLEEGMRLPPCLAKSTNQTGTTYNREIIYFEILEAGTYFLTVDGRTSDDIGTYELALSCEFNCIVTETSISCEQSINDRIPSRQEEPFGNFTSNYCGINTAVPGTGITGNERSYLVTIESDGNYDFDLTVPANSLADFELILLNSIPENNGGTCGFFDNCVAIATNGGFGDNERISTFLEPGEYYLVVDGWFGSWGDYTVSMSCDGGGGNEGNICTEAIDLDCNTTYTGSTIDGDNGYTNNDYACAASSITYNGNDDVFRVEHPGGRFVASLLNGNGVDHDLFLLQDAVCDGDEAFGLDDGRLLPPCLAVSDNFGGGVSNREVIYVEELAAGTYYLVVDGRTSDDIGSYELALSCQFNCLNSNVDLTCGQTINDRIPSRQEEPVGNYTSNYCRETSIGPGSGTGATGNERAYRINITTAGTYTFDINVPAGSLADFQLALLNSVDVANGPGETCGFFDDCVGIAANNGEGGSESLTLFLQPNEYYLVVDGWLSSFGNFSLSMSCDDDGECGDPFYHGSEGFAVTRQEDGRYAFFGIIGDFSTEHSYQVNFSDIQNSGLSYTGDRTSELVIDFGNNGGSYTICYPFIETNGCVNYRCLDLCVEANDAPYRFQAIDQPDNERIRFLLGTPSPPVGGGVSDISWFYYDDGEQIVISNSAGLFIPYPDACFTRTYFVRYFDNGNECWRIERRTLEICPPDQCNETAYLDNCNSQRIIAFDNGNYNVSPGDDLATDLPWLFNRQPRPFNGEASITLQNGPRNQEICYPTRNEDGCIEYCCRQYCLDGLTNSPLISINYDQETRRYRLRLNETDGVSQAEWFEADGTTNGFVLSSGRNLSVPVPANCVTRVYAVRYFSGGCWRMARRTVYLCDPFACEGIAYQYIDDNNTFSLSIEGDADVTQPLAWVDDDSGNSLGTTPTIPIPVPPGDCQTRNISVRYFDRSRQAWVICCRTIYLCDPNQCDGILYQYSTEAQAFDLSIDGADTGQPLAWVDDDTGADLGSTPTIPVPVPPGTCQTRNISVRYFDAFRQAWVICCRSIYLCSPVSCEDRIDFNYANGNAIVSANIGDSNRNWFVNGSPAGSGGTVAVPLTPGQRAEVCVQYFDPSVNGFRTCCKEVTIPNCELPQTGFIVVEDDNVFTALNTSEGNGDNSYRWEVNGENASASQNLTLDLPPGRYTICLTATNDCGSQRFCRQVTIPDTENDLIFRPLPGACGAPGEVIEIPIYADNFNNILNYQLTLALTDTAVAKIVGLELVNIPGVEDFLIYNAGRAAVIWDNSSGLFYPDGTLLMTLRVRIQGSDALSSDIILASGPVPAYAENGNSEEVPISMIRGTINACSEVEVSGNLLTESGEGIARATVSLFRNDAEVSQVITDATGSYTFTITPDGADYAIRPSKLINYRNHVNSGDLSAVRRHIFGTAPLPTPYRRIAADVSNIGSINSGDISTIRQLIFGLIPAFPGVPSWEFVPQNHVFVNPGNPNASPYPRTINLGRVSGNQGGLNFVGMKMGDPSMGADPQNARPDRPVSSGRSASNLTFILGDNPPMQGVPYELNVYAHNFTNMFASQFSLTWDTELIQLLEIKNENETLGLTADNFSTALVREGKLPWLWFAEQQAVSLPDSTLLFTLKFNNAGQFGDTVAVNFTEMPTEFYFENSGGEIPADFSADTQVVEWLTSTSDHSTLDQIRVYPNPAKDLFYLDAPAGAELSVNLYSLQGQLLREWHERSSQSSYDIKDLPAGTYLITLQQDGKRAIRRLVIQ